MRAVKKFSLLVSKLANFPYLKTNAGGPSQFFAWIDHPSPQKPVVFLLASNDPAKRGNFLTMRLAKKLHWLVSPPSSAQCTQTERSGKNPVFPRHRAPKAVEEKANHRAETRKTAPQRRKTHLTTEPEKLKFIHTHSRGLDQLIQPPLTPSLPDRDAATLALILTGKRRGEVSGKLSREIRIRGRPTTKKLGDAKLETSATNANFAPDEK